MWVKKDKWLFCDGAFMDSILKTEQVRDFLVGDFIDSDSCCWKVDK